MYVHERKPKMEKMVNVLLPLYDIIQTVSPVPTKFKGKTHIAPSCTKIHMHEINVEPVIPVALAATTKRKSKVVTPYEVSRRVKAKEDGIDTDIFGQEVEKLDKEIQQSINDIRPRDLGAQALDIKHSFTEGK